MHRETISTAPAESRHDRYSKTPGIKELLHLTISPQDRDERLQNEKNSLERAIEQIIRSNSDACLSAIRPIKKGATEHKKPASPDEWIEDKVANILRVGPTDDCVAELIETITDPGKPFLSRKTDLYNNAITLYPQERTEEIINFYIATIQKRIEGKISQKAARAKQKLPENWQKTIANMLWEVVHRINYQTQCLNLCKTETSSTYQAVTEILLAVFTDKHFLEEIKNLTKKIDTILENMKRADQKDASWGQDLSAMIKDQAEYERIESKKHPFRKEEEPFFLRSLVLQYLSQKNGNPKTKRTINDTTQQMLAGAPLPHCLRNLLANIPGIANESRCGVVLLNLIIDIARQVGGALENGTITQKFARDFMRAVPDALYALLTQIDIEIQRKIEGRIDQSCLAAPKWNSRTPISQPLSP